MRTPDRPDAVPRTDPPSADEDVAELRLQLRTFSLAELEEEGVVEWDRENHVVTKGPHFDEIWPEEGCD